MDFVIKNGVLLQYTGNDENVVIPEGVTTIGTSAFKGDRGIKTVVLPWGLAKICACAFEDCKGLETIYIPKTVNRVGDYAFHNCTALKEAVFEGKRTQLSRGVFEGCTQLSKVHLPANIQRISQNLFTGCYALEEVTIPRGVHNIDYRAFYKSGLHKVYLPDSLCIVGTEAFWWCRDLKEVSAPAGLQVWYGFSRSVPIMYRELPQEPAKVEDFDIKNGCLRVYMGGTSGEVCVPEGVREIAPEAFKDAKMSKVYLPSSVTRIGDEAFRGCLHLQEVHCPEQLERIGAGVFKYCVRLKKIELPRGIEVLHKGLLMGCQNLEEVVIPEGVKHIEQDVFEECTSLIKISIPDSVAINVQEVLPKWPRLEIDASPEWKAQHEGEHINLSTIAYIEDDVLVKYKGGAEEYKIPDKIRVIGAKAFSDHKELQKVVFSEGVEEIGINAFEKCMNLKEIVIPDGMECKISKVFDDYQELIITATPQWKLRHQGEHKNLPYTETCIHEDRLIRYVGSEGCYVLPAHIRELDVDAFKGDGENLQRIVLPDGMKKINSAVFRHCNPECVVVVPDSTRDIMHRPFGDMWGYGFDLESLQQYVKIEVSEWFKDTHWRALDEFRPYGPELDILNSELQSCCTQKECLVLREGIRKIENGAFGHWCPNLKKITVPDSLEKISIKAIPPHIEIVASPQWNQMYEVELLERQYPGFWIVRGVLIAYDGKETDIRIPHVVQNIAGNALRGNRKITRMTIPATVRVIDDRAFAEMWSLQEVIIEGGESLGKGLFENDKNLKCITLSDKVKEIPERMFYRCGKLENVTLPAGVKSIGKEAFKECPALKQSVIPDTSGTAG